MKEISEKEAMKLFDKQGEYDPEELWHIAHIRVGTNLPTQINL
jgi:hypothetical protein